ncbi:MAG: GTP-binding protein era-like protein [uncultured bacterium (gcode 4)]|uniref:GTPase Era n=1 Tax=uncultured bacterium (gcode 4) TaxID=1234023 RepID=K2AFP6_9BACT|nr:MAG: GTP-binding protein era-like protein [uncultured bacterium (gcode 4)]
MQNLTKKKVGYVALIGRPNSGKSTFINTLLDEKVSIISARPQTTQKVIKWIYNDTDSQIIFFDTPGINENKEGFYEILRENVLNSLKNAEVIVRFIDSSRQYWREEQEIEEIIQNVSAPIIEVYSKVDLTKSPKTDKLNISSIDKTWYAELISQIKNFLKEDFPYYDEDYYTDQDIYTRITEIIREKIFTDFKEEVPYSVYLEVGEIEETPRLLKVQVYLYTETDSQKKIIIWKWAENLTKIGTESRLELQKILDKKIFLSLRVKVMPKWKRNKKLLNKLYN